MDDQVEPTHCTRCSSELLGAYVTTYRSVQGKDCEVNSILCLSCDKRERWAAYAEFGVLRTRLIPDAVMTAFRKPEVFVKLHFEVLKIYTAQILPAIKTLERRVWFKGLQAKMLASDWAGLSVDTQEKDQLSWLIFSSAGRTLMTLADPSKTYSITVICAADTPDRSTMGLQSIDAHAEDALDLLSRAVQVWNRGAAVRPNERARIL